MQYSHVVQSCSNLIHQMLRHHYVITNHVTISPNISKVTCCSVQHHSVIARVIPESPALHTSSIMAHLLGSPTDQLHAFAWPTSHEELIEMQRKQKTTAPKPPTQPTYVAPVNYTPIYYKKVNFTASQEPWKHTTQPYGMS